MILETVITGRGWGKTHYLIQRIQEAQDAGAELVAVVTHNEREAKRWADHVVEWEIDPSRFIVFTAQSALQGGGRGWEVDHLYVDNADLMTEDLLQEIQFCFAHDIDVLTATG